EFKREHRNKVIKIYGSVEKYNEYIERVKSNEEKIAKMAIKQYAKVLPFGDLATIPFYMAFIVCFRKGNIVQSVITGTIVIAISLY
ncbi:PTS transporter subunit IIC, partial [Clostridioides difficile]|uniref:PTS transporter subunit IIC n=1 Tax=Clostridioides difficile TaxID=1496 RepID=UPI003F8D50FC